MTCLVPSSKASLKSQGQVLLGEVGRLDEGEELLLVLGMKGGLKVLTIFVREVKVIMATNKVVVLAGGQVKEVVVLMLDVDGVEDRQEEAEAGVAVEEDRGAGGRSFAIGASPSTITLGCPTQSSSRGRPPLNTSALERR